MAYTTINKSTDHFNTKLWAGNGSSQALTGVGHQTDMVWIKSRTDTRKHNLYDVVRGVQKRIVPNDTVAEDTVPGVTAFGTDGFTVGSETDTNGGSRNFVGWSWKAGNSAGSANNDGSVASTVSVNTTAGFSIVKWTGTGATATVGHGLGAKPSIVLIKNTGATENWVMYHGSLGAEKNLKLNNNEVAQDTTGAFNDTEPTSSVFTVHTNTNVNQSGQVMIAYCFAEKSGYSKFGSYEGNNNSNGTFIYTGFKPNFVITKNIDAANDWILFDDARKTPAYNGNLANSYVYPSSTSAEGYNASTGFDLLSNGFKMRNTFGASNEANTYIYLAFGQSLVGSNNIPCTAR